MIATCPPPRGPGRAELILMIVLVAITYMILSSTALRAEAMPTLGYRLQVEACRENMCRPILPSPSRWTNQFACQSRAATLEQIGLDLPLERLGLPRGTWIIKARCAPVKGMPSA